MQYDDFIQKKQMNIKIYFMTTRKTGNSTLAVLLFLK